MNIRVLDDIFKVTYRSKRDCDDEKCYGWCQYDPPEICVQENLSPTKEAHILVHEVMHALVQTLRGIEPPLHDGKKTEEYFITLLSLGIVNTFKDNPELLDLVYDLITGNK